MSDRLIILLALLGTTIMGALYFIFFIVVMNEKPGYIIYKFDNTTYFVGTMTHGATEELSETLDDDDILFIESPGGRMEEGYRMSELLQELETDVYVGEYGCWSACSIGVAHQELSGSGVIGVHSTSLNGHVGFIERWANEDAAEHYEEAGRDEWAAAIREHSLDFVEFKIDK